MGNGLLAAAVLAVLAPAARAQSTATLKGIDVYRSEQVTSERLEAKFAPLLQTYTRLRGEGGRGGPKAAGKIKAQIEEGVRRMGSFAFVDLYYMEYLTSAEHTAYATFDLVDSKDAKVRMPFRPAPSAKLKDPDGLLAAWRDYSELGMRLMSEGALTTDRAPCPGYYCLWGSVTPELAALEKRFADGAEAEKTDLSAVLLKDADPRKRADAAFVLAYIKDGKEVSDLMTEALDDPAEEVREAALQVFSDISLYHKAVFIDAARVVAAEDDPAAAVRSRAVGVLIALADNPAYRPYVLSRAPARLLGLLKQQQPNVHDLAFTLLSLLSKQTYDRRDYDSWEKWITLQQSSAAAVSPSAAPPAPK